MHPHVTRWVVIVSLPMVSILGGARSMPTTCDTKVQVTRPGVKPRNVRLPQGEGPTR